MRSEAGVLADSAREIVCTADPEMKVAKALATARQWTAGALSLTRRIAPVMPNRPARPDRPELMPPRKVARRGIDTERGRIAHLHALAHIELNAIDMAWDLIGRFANAPLPRAFFDDWVRVGQEEAIHFAKLSSRLDQLGACYGDLPAHDGLWQAAEETSHDLLARLAIVPLVLEARGLDVTPAMIERFTTIGDRETAAILEIIYRDEKSHVAIGFRWFSHVCRQRECSLEPTFHALVRKHFRGQVKPPFNVEARTVAGLAPSFYKPLAPILN